jgi:phage baseplate assembly protein W
MAADIQRGFLGIGWAFPPSLKDGQAVTAEYEEAVRQSILIILGTNPGERVMRPDYGAGLNAFVFEPLNTNTIESVRKKVEEALVDYEPRIILDKVRVVIDASRPGRLLIEIDYRVRSTNAVRNLVYPFYLEESK